MSRNHLRDALAISLAAVAWGVLSGVASIVAGIAASSTALVGTGADVLADVLSSVVLIWRFRAELHGLAAPETVERRAQRVSSAALIIVAIVIAVLAAIRLVIRQGASATAAGIAIATHEKADQVLATLPALKGVPGRLELAGEVKGGLVGAVQIDQTSRCCRPGGTRSGRVGACCSGNPGDDAARTSRRTDDDRIPVSHARGQIETGQVGVFGRAAGGCDRVGDSGTGR